MERAWRKEDLRRRERSYVANWLSDRRVKGLRRKSGGDFGVILKQVIFEILGGDFIERTGGNPGSNNAHRLGLRENFHVLQAKFHRNFVNSDWHMDVVCSYLGELAIHIV